MKKIILDEFIMTRKIEKITSAIAVSYLNNTAMFTNIFLLFLVVVIISAISYRFIFKIYI